MQRIYQNPPTHLVAVDCIIFGYEQEDLKLLLFKRQLPPAQGEWSLIGGWVNEDCTVEQANQHVLKTLTGLEGIPMEQVSIYSKPDRDPGGRVISISFYALINVQEKGKELEKQFGAEWFSVKELPNLIFDHNEMVADALRKLRFDGSKTLLGHGLLNEEFTLSQLRSLYNSIYDKEFDPGNFRKKILSLKVLERLNKKDFSESKKGAFYYKYKPDNEIEYNERIVNLK